MTQGGSGRLSADRGDSGWLGVARGRSRRRRTDHGARGRAGSERPGGLTGAAVLLSCGDLVTLPKNQPTGGCPRGYSDWCLARESPLKPWLKTEGD